MLKRIFLYMFLLKSFFLAGFSQGRILIPHPDTAALHAEDRERALMGTFSRFAVGVPVHKNMALEGSWNLEADNTYSCHLHIIVPNAKGVALFFNRLELSDQGEILIKTPDNHLEQIIKANELESPEGWLSEFFPGDHLIIEYKNHRIQDPIPLIEVEHVAVAYRMLYFPNFPQDKDFGDADACQVNVNCSPEGTNWQDVKRSVVRILLKEGTSYGWCSGAMVNNTNQDCTPYILTANHCGAGASAADFRNWKYYFNYESPTCPNPSGQGTLATQTITGSMKVASSSDNSTIVKSDFLLTLLRRRPDSSYNAYLSGWSRSNTGSPSGVGIHHPMGDIKKISTYTQTLLSATWGGTPGSHWQVKWNATANGHGVTEEGSSGSPIFNSSKQIVGQLSGGSSYCDQPNNPDGYGKFWYNWDQTASTENRQLMPWLDRNNSNPTVLGGRSNNCSNASVPVVEFVASATNVQAGTVVTLTDLSTGNPFAWNWQITPSTYYFTQSTTANSQNPKVVFTNQGTYSVTLMAGNIAGYELKVRNAYITVTGTASDENLENHNTIMGMTIFPNPTSDILKVEIPLIEPEKLHWELIDIAGKVIKSGYSWQSSLTIPVNDLAPGLFLIKVVASDQSQAIRKFLKL